jgi:hypothetical protein
MKFPLPVFCFFVFSGLLCSCVGLKTEIVMKADGTGTLRTTYRIAREFMDIGALDGNERWPGVPVGRADFERSVAGMEGLTLVSYSAKEEGADLVCEALVGFSKLEDVLPLLDYGGTAASLVRGEKLSLVLRLTPEREPGTDVPSPDLLAAAEEAFRGYDFALSLSAPSPVEMKVRGENGPRIERDGKKAGFSVPIYELISRSGPLTVEFVF